MNTINAAAAALGRVGGSKTSAAKRAASRANARTYWQSPAGVARRASMCKAEPENASVLDALEAGGHAVGLSAKTINPKTT
jgi:hypothetical protein